MQPTLDMESSFLPSSSMHLSCSLFRSGDLITIQQQSDSPFGMLFLTVPQPKSLEPSTDAKKKVSTQDTEETSNDGKSKLDPLYDEDEEEEEEIPENY